MGNYLIEPHGRVLRVFARFEAKFLFATFGFLLLAGVAAISIVVLLLLFIVWSLAGRRIAGFSQVDHISIAASVIVGSGIQVLTSQVLILLGVNSSFAYFSTITALTALAVMQLRSRSRRSELLDTKNELTQSALATLAVCSLNHPWLIPFAIASSSLLVAKSLETRRPSSRIVYFFVFLIGWLISTNLRPGKWWFAHQSNDIGFFESLSWSIAKWGVSEHPGAVGGSIANYHWYTYGFAGLISQMSRLEPWTMLTIIGPALSSFLVASLLLSRRPRDRIVAGGTNIFVVCGVVQIIGVKVFDSFRFSIIIALVFIEIALRLESRKYTNSKISLTFVVALITYLAKVSTAADTLGVFAIVSLLKIRRKHGIKTKEILICLASAIALGLLIVELFGSSSARIQAIVGEFEVGYFFESTRGLLGQPETFVALLLVAGLSLQREGYLKLESPSSVILVATIIFGVLVLPFFLLLNSPYLGYFFLPTLLVAASYSIQTLNTRMKIYGRNLQLSTVASTAGLTFVFFQFVWWTNNELIDLLPLFRPTVYVLVFSGPLLVTLMTITAVQLLRHISVTRHLPATPIILLVCLGYLFGAGLSASVNSYRQIPGGFYSGGEPTFGNPPLEDVAEYIRRNTDTGAILASNSFLKSQHPYEFSEKTQWGGSLYLLPAETQRRFLMQGLRFQGVGNPDFPTSDQFKRAQISVEFANRPNERVLNSLKSYGVSGYVVDLSLTENRDWSSVATVAFESAEFMFLILK